MANFVFPKSGNEQVDKWANWIWYYQTELDEFPFTMTAWGELIKLDNSVYPKIKAQTFGWELIALSLELFGLAWFEHIWELDEQDKITDIEGADCLEIMITKTYRDSNNDVWKAMGFYNEVILQAVYEQKNSWHWSIPRPGYYAEEHTLQFSLESDKKCLERDVADYDKILNDNECAMRLAKRSVCYHEWQKGIMIPQRLAQALASRVGYAPNLEAHLLLERIVVGLYDKAKDYIDTVVEYGSFEQAMKSGEKIFERAACFLQVGIPRFC